MSWNLLYALDAFAILIFLVSYYWNCYRRGYRIDFWHVELFLFCVLPNMIMLPFSGSVLNAPILGTHFAAVVAALPNVFLITIVGYFAMLAGGSLWRLHAGLGIRKATIRVLDIVPRSSMMLMSSRSLLVFQAFICFLLQVIILLLYFSQSGFGFDLRGFTFANPALRPVALVISNYSVIIASHCLARYVDKKEKMLLACTLLLTVGLVFFGARSNLLAIYLGVLLCFLVRLRNRISLFRIVGLTSIITLVGLYLGDVRAGEYSIANFLAAVAVLIFYGNNFSDLRDFAWVYAGWDHVFWKGKTYAAALMAFVPRVASDFRNTWGMGVATDLTAGLDPTVHPGLRPSAFGEGFFNFGLFGVVAIGLMLGIICRRVDIDVKRALANPRPSMMRAFASAGLTGIASCLTATAGFSGLYILAGTYLFSWFCLGVVQLFHPAKKSPL